MISGQTASRDVSYISQGLVPDLPFQSNPRDQFRWLHQSQRRCFEQGGSLSRTEWVKSNFYKLFDYIVFVLAVFVWFVILFMRFKFLSNWNCHYSAENWVGALKKKFWFALLNVNVCKYIVFISIGGLYQCYIVTKT